MFMVSMDPKFWIIQIIRTYAMVISYMFLNISDMKKYTAKLNSAEMLDV